MRKLYIADIRSNSTSSGISTGHFVPVARMYQQLFLERAEVIVAGGPVFKQYFDDKDLFVLPYNVSGDGFVHKLKTFANFIRLFKVAKGHTIVLQQSTDVTTHIALALFYHGGSKVFLIRYSKAGLSSHIKRFVYALCRHKVDGIICPNKEVGYAYRCPFCVVPDYIYTGSVSPQIAVQGCNSIYDFCIVGRIAEEKGIVEIVRKLAGTRYKTIIAGKTQTEELQKSLLIASEGAANIDLRIGYVTDEEYYDILSKSKYALLNYQGEYSRRSSGVVYDTLFSNVPIIGKRCTALQFVEDYKVGYLYDTLDVLDFKTLDQLLCDSIISGYQNNIVSYCNINKACRVQLVKFILE